MKYWSITFPGEFGQHVVEVWSEEQILASYLPYWTSRMIEVGKQDQISRERCIDDWIVLHWAIETDKFGTPLCNQTANAAKEQEN